MGSDLLHVHPSFGIAYPLCRSRKPTALPTASGSARGGRRCRVFFFSASLRPIRPTLRAHQGRNGLGLWWPRTSASTIGSITVRKHRSRRGHQTGQH
jgi:hypothetical protein